MNDTSRIYLLSSCNYKAKKAYVSLPAIFGDESFEMFMVSPNSYLWYLDIQIPTDSDHTSTSIKFLCLTDDDNGYVSINPQRLFYPNKERGYYHNEKQSVNKLEQSTFLVFDQLMNDIKDWKTFIHSMDILVSLRYIYDINKLWKSSKGVLSTKYYKTIYVFIQFLARFTKKMHLINEEAASFLDFIKNWDFQKCSVIHSRPWLKKLVEPHSYASKLIFLFDMKNSEIFYNMWCIEQIQQCTFWNFKNYMNLLYPIVKGKWDGLINRVSKSSLMYNDGIYFKDCQFKIYNDKESVDYMLLYKYLKIKNGTNIVESFHSGLYKIAGLCETLNYPSIINLPYNVLNAYKTALALGLELDTYSWDRLDDIKYNFLKLQIENAPFASVDEALWFYNHALKDANSNRIDEDDMVEID